MGQQMQAAQQMQSLNPMAIQAQLRAMYPEMSHEEVMARTRWTIMQLQSQMQGQMYPQQQQQQGYGYSSQLAMQQQLQQQQGARAGNGEIITLDDSPVKRKEP